MRVLSLPAYQLFDLSEQNVKMLFDGVYSKCTHIPPVGYCCGLVQTYSKCASSIPTVNFDF